MDTGTLVASKVRDGKSLINQLDSDQIGIGVSVAFWVRTSEEGSWNLWIASPAVDPNDRSGALPMVYTALDSIPGCEVTPMEITVVEAANPVARAAAAARDRYPSQELVRYDKGYLGTLRVEEVYIYQLPLPLDVRESDGRWEVLIANPDVWLSCDSEEDAQVIAAARVLKHQALAGLRSGPEFVAELERTADTLEKYRMNFGSRFLRRRAHAVRSALPA